MEEAARSGEIADHDRPGETAICLMAGKTWLRRQAVSNLPPESLIVAPCEDGDLNPDGC
jgi:hypothetical protein